MAKTYIKKKQGPNAAGPKYRTPDFIKGKKLSANKFNKKNFAGKSTFNPSTFKVQHKG